MDDYRFPKPDFTTEIAESLLLGPLQPEEFPRSVCRVAPPIDRCVLNPRMNIQHATGNVVRDLERLSLWMTGIDRELNHIGRLATDGEKIIWARRLHEHQTDCFDAYLDAMRVARERVEHLEEEVERLKTGSAAPRWPRKERPQGRGECNRPGGHFQRHCPGPKPSGTS